MYDGSLECTYNNILARFEKSDSVLRRSRHSEKYETFFFETQRSDTVTV